jgi:hypothetical protein
MWRDDASYRVSTLCFVGKGRRARLASFIRSKDYLMTKSVTTQYVTALTPIAVLCLFAFLSIDFSPALAAAVLRLANVRAMPATVRAMIGPLCARGNWLTQLRACEGFFRAASHSAVSLQKSPLSLSPSMT